MKTKKPQSYSFYFVFSFLPMLLLLVGLFYFYGWTYLSSISFVVSYLLVYLFGVSLFYHRYWSHKQFVPHPVALRFFTFTGLLGMVGGPTFYALIHRTHHKHVDSDLDPHSPSHGIWHAFMGWLFTAHRKLELNSFYIKDLFGGDCQWMLRMERYQIQIIWTVPLLTLIVNPYITIGLLAAMFATYVIEMCVNGFLHDTKGNVRTAPYLISFLTAGATQHGQHHEAPGGELQKADIGYRLVKLFDTRK
jgi:fatty-acid desaturase